jgi:hypothetical protein
VIGNLLLRHRKLVPCTRPASVCSSAPRRLHPKSSLFFASISKTPISRRLTHRSYSFSVEFRQRGPLAGAELAIKLFRHSRMLEAGIQAKL